MSRSRRRKTPIVGHTTPAVWPQLLQTASPGLVEQVPAQGEGGVFMPGTRDQDSSG
jgi:hypothetical protein